MANLLKDWPTLRGWPGPNKPHSEPTNDFQRTTLDEDHICQVCTRALPAGSQCWLQHAAEDDELWWVLCDPCAQLKFNGDLA